jgi:heterodisulfide reductase subunit A2
MIVLARGMEPHADAQEVRRLFNLSCGTEGWFLERHPKLAPVSTFTDGIFIAGCCQGPKDIPDSIAQAGAAAAEAMALIDKGYIEQEPNTAYITAECSGCKSCMPLCPYTAISFDEATAKAVHQRGALQRLRHLRGLLPVGFDPAAPVRRRGDLQRNRRSAELKI